MTAIENRIVKMTFDNGDFKKGAQETQKSLSDLDKSLENTGKGKGLLGISAAASTVTASVSKMTVLTTAALATIATKITQSGIAMAKSVSIDPIRDGMAEYESLLTKQNVIMNATGASSEKVKKILDELNTYSDETIYSFGNMASAITKFVNAGIPLEQATVSIKGIANAAAFAGASAEEADRAMYAFSQAMSMGYIGLMDWNQIENANMGTQKFKQTLIESAVELGTLTKKGKEYVTSSGKVFSSSKNWRDSLQDQWATADVMNAALTKYTDQNTELGRKAQKAATEVRTFTALMDTLKESVGSGWAQFFRIIGGDVEEATKKWTGISEKVGLVTSAFFNFLHVNAQVFKDLGGMTKITKIFTNILSPFIALVKALGAAWTTVFGKGELDKTGKSLYTVVSVIEALTRPITYLAEAITRMTPKFVFFFEIVKIGVETAKKGLDAFFSLFKTNMNFSLKDPFSSGGFIGGLKAVSAYIREVINNMADLIKKGDDIETSFDKVFKKTNKMSFAKLGDDVKKATKTINKSESKDVFNPNAKLDTSQIYGQEKKQKTSTGTQDTSIADDFQSRQEMSANRIQSTFDNLLTIFKAGWDKLTNFASNIKTEDVVGAFNLALGGTVGLNLARVFKSFNDVLKAVATVSDVTGSLSGLLDTAGGALKSFQTQAKAKLILNIAIAIGILAAALLVLSFIPEDKLKKALLGLTAVMTSMSATMFFMTKTLNKLEGEGMSVKLVALSFAFVALGVGMLALALAAKIMDSVGLDGVIKNMVTMRVVLISFERLGGMAENAAKNILAAAFAFGVISASMIVLAGAGMLFSFVKWESLAKAGLVIGALVGSLMLLSKVDPAKLSIVGSALLAASVGLLAISIAFVLFGLVSWESIAKGTVVLIILAAALAALMVVGNPVAIAGIVSLGFALILLAGAMLILNSVEWSSIGKFTVILLVLIGALALLLAVLAAGAVVIPILAAFAAVLLMLSFAFVMFATAMAIVVSIAAVGTAAFGALATGAAVAIGLFFQSLALQAPLIGKSINAIIKVVLKTIADSVPIIAQGIRDIWAAIIKEFQRPENKTLLGNESKSWIEKITDSLKENMPKIVEAATTLILKFLEGLNKDAKSLGAAGVVLISKFISGITSKVDLVAKAGADMIIAWMRAIYKQLGRIAKTAADVVIEFINTLAKTIESKGEALGRAGARLGMAIVKGIIKGIKAYFGEALDEIGKLATGLVDKAKKILKIFSPSRVFADIGRFLVVGLTQGIQSHAASAINAVGSLVSGQIAMASSYINKYIQELDQKAIAAQAKADGLAKAASKAATAAKKTKTKSDDKAAKKLKIEADKASKEAEMYNKKKEKEKEILERKEKFESSSFLDKAKMRSEDAQTTLDLAKESEARAAAAQAEAAGLRKQAKAKGVTKKQRASFLKQAKELEARVKNEATQTNNLMDEAARLAAEALDWQRKAGDEASKLFDERYKEEADSDAAQEAYEKLSDKEKAEHRKKQAEEMQKQADADLMRAKELAYTDLTAANELAEKAMDQADQAREYLKEAESLAKSTSVSSSGSVVNLDPTEAASIAFNDYASQYQNAMAAAAASNNKIEFNQYNTSPEALSPSEVYRHTNNQLTFAADKISNNVLTK